MGAVGFINTTKAETAREAYHKLVNEAILYEGDNPYNGTISTCEMTRHRATFEIASKENTQKAYEIVKADDYGNKWETWYIDLGPKKKGDKEHVFMFYGLASC